MGNGGGWLPIKFDERKTRRKMTSDEFKKPSTSDGNENANDAPPPPPHHSATMQVIIQPKINKET